MNFNLYVFILLLVYEGLNRISPLSFSAGALLDMWRCGTLAVAAVVETLAMCNGKVDQRLFLQPGGRAWLLPALIAADTPGGDVQFLWVGRAWRRKGVGAGMVRLSGFTRPNPRHVLDSAIPFWTAIGMYVQTSLHG